MKESALRDKLIKALKPYCHVVKMENTAAVGTPDLYICYRGHSIWIELKAFLTKLPKSLGKKNGASWKREQLWAWRHLSNGGDCRIIVHAKNMMEPYRLYTYTKNAIPGGFTENINCFDSVDTLVKYLLARYETTSI